MDLFNERNEVIETVKRYTSINPDGLKTLWGLAEAVRPVPGAVVECGVMSGGSAAMFWRAMGGGKRHLWCFDSWEGLPKPTENDGGRALSKYDYKMATIGSWCKGDLDQAKQVVAAVGCHTATFVKGWFRSSVPIMAQRIGPVALLHLDADFYNSTFICLEHLYPLLVSGGMLILNDYNFWPGTNLAVRDYSLLTGEDFSDLVEMGKCGAYMVKQ